MYAPGQTALGAPHALRGYAANGATQFTTTLGPVSNGEDQRTVLIGDTAVAGADFVEGSLNNLTASGGAVCFMVDPAFNTAVDCVSWGNFTPVGFPAAPGGSIGNPESPAGIPAGNSIVRSIAGGACATALEEADDTGDSANDFAPSATPSPTSNAGFGGTPCAPPTTLTPPGNPASPINPAGNVRKRKCKPSNRAAAAKKKKCKKKK
jgi:hypothetical protein